MIYQASGGTTTTMESIALALTAPHRILHGETQAFRTSYCVAGWRGQNRMCISQASEIVVYLSWLWCSGQNHCISSETCTRQGAKEVQYE